PRRDNVYDLYTDPEKIDDETFAQALTSFKTKLAVFTAPPEILPLDILSGDDIHKILLAAQLAYDFVIVDMPTWLAEWSSTVLQMAETYFTIMELDMRSAQNTMRFLRALKAEELPDEKLQFALNYAPSFTDLNGKARARRFSESLGIDINIFLPDGGKQVAQTCDQGAPLAEGAPKNPLRKEIRKIAASLISMAEEQKAAIA
ncbi:MAG TPA: pilus assembly protein CpaE, partial [Paracoccaceae bacterium]|nr:pilus assembly protein CpaE [Paracoccaceae bacterium]